ncbi:MAG: exo-alpha-sialidase [Euryarchaeota archaeon]|nr:exo-alpha-sialidase [Euryarchaeota archaeon]
MKLHDAAPSSRLDGGVTVTGRRVVLALVSGSLLLVPALALGPSGEFQTLNCDPACNVVAFSGPANDASIVINPADPRNLIAAAKDYSLTTPSGLWCSSVRVWSGVYTSLDAGATWTSSFIPGHNLTDHPLSNYTCSTDPVVAFDSQGAAYYFALGVNGSQDSPDLFVAKSIDKGLSWRFLSVVDQCAGRPAAAADRETNRVYVVWVHLCEPGATGAITKPVRFAYSADGGSSWLKTAAISGSAISENEGPAVATGALGQTYVAWRDVLAGAILVGVTNNLGQSFVVTMAAVCTCQGDVHLRPVGPLKQPDREDEEDILRGYPYVSIPAMGVDLSGGPNHGSVYIAYTDFSQERGEVRVVSSRTGGFDWSPAVPVNDQIVVSSNAASFAPVADEFMPALAVGPAGDVHVAYYSTRMGSMQSMLDHLLGVPSGEPLDAYYAHSEDAIVWDANVRLSSESFDPYFSYHQDGFRSIGDLLGIAAGPDSAHAVWSDTRTGTTALMTAKVER